jgi:hypothetical protein
MRCPKIPLYHIVFSKTDRRVIIKMGKNTKIPHCENISKVQQKNCRNKMENKYYPIIVTVPSSN